ncbi:tellurium resistance protein [Fictibacillus macauensis ZFHKF-1]|uniref:Tellurium resistance protein n=1 Tax=Fictibacillus macauensis ZFHKF-1 TaxID=1196324 RepID=I8AKT7_9BACL|nr:TerD family protein [Fictibacillus macauensis]EIT86194.1 tellurium resistance protein [Fictibacillus macauensis ZFHKF-1]
MAITLQKGQKVDLTKGKAGLTSLMVGLGWDPVQPKKAGFFASLKPSANIDCDASVLMLDEQGKVANNKDVIYFGNQQSLCKSVKHMGDNLTGEGEGDDEQVFVDLSRIPQNIHRLVFVVNIYSCVSRKQDFGMIENAYIRVLNSSSNESLLHFNLSDHYGGLTSLVAGEIYRYNGEWKFNAIGDGTKDTSLEEIVRRYR